MTEVMTLALQHISSTRKAMDRSWPSVDGWADNAYDSTTRKAMAATMALVNERGMHVGIFAINIYKNNVFEISRHFHFQHINIQHE